MTHLFLVRHGETDWNAAKRIQGSTDIPLTDTGRAQAGRPGRLLSTRAWDGIVSSPLARAVETASLIAREIGLDDPTEIDAIAERNYGEAEGLDYVTLDRLYPNKSAIPGRESRAEVAARVLPALGDLARRRAGQSIVVVTHGGVIRTLLGQVAPGDTRLAGIPITNGSVHSFRFRDGALDLHLFDDQIDAAPGEGRATHVATSTADRAG